MYHQSKLTRHGTAGPRIPQATRGGSTGLPGQSRHLTCGNNEDGEPGPGRTQGRTAAARSTARHHQESTVTASRCCPPVPHRSRSRVNRPDDLATELNPRKTGLNLHKAVPGG